ERYSRKAPMTRPSPFDLLTIGHSNHPAERFLALLKDAGVTAVADVRSVPRSRRFPWFSGKVLAESLEREGIAYIPLGDELVGRALAQLGLALGHILGDGTIEPHAATEERLIARAGSSADLFQDRAARLAQAYRRRARAVAARA